MKRALFICLFALFIYLAQANQHDHGADLEDNEFAEFEDFDDGSEAKAEEAATQQCNYLQNFAFLL